MIARVLPPEEWPRLKGTEAEGFWPHLKPECARVIVVEEDGEIIATWTLVTMVHAECLWASPKHRGFGVTRRLLAKMREVCAEWGVTSVVTGSQSEHVTDLINRFGGSPVPGQSFYLPIHGFGTKRMKDREMGRAFHKQLEAHAVDGLHPEDERHDEAVGKTLRIAIEEKDPERALTEYNTWAGASGYEPIKYLGIVDGKFRADIVSAVIDVDDHFAIQVVEREAIHCQ